MKFEDLSGKRFGKLLVIEDTGKRASGNRCIIYRCRCDCGNYRDAISEALRRGFTTACRDCYKKERHHEQNRS
jgi:hypothetical protein